MKRERKMTEGKEEPSMPVFESSEVTEEWQPNSGGFSVDLLFQASV